MLWPNNKRTIKWLFFFAFIPHTVSHTLSTDHIWYTHISMWLGFISSSSCLPNDTSESGFTSNWRGKSLCDYQVANISFGTMNRIPFNWIEHFGFFSLTFKLWPPIDRTCFFFFLVLLQPITNTIHRYLIENGSINQYRINKSVCVGLKKKNAKRVKNMLEWSQQNAFIITHIFSGFFVYQKFHGMSIAMTGHHFTTNSL